MKKRKPRGYWTKERVLADAKKYTQRLKWQKKSGSAYVTARRKKWLEEATAHMDIVGKPSGYWQIKKNVLAEAKKYESIFEWQKVSSASQASARKNGWFEESTAHMTRTLRPSGYWQVKENVIEDAKKYSSRSEWKLNSGSSPVINAKKNGWYDEATAHMELLGSRFHRCIYAIKVKDTNLCYIGLSGNLKKRFADHLKTPRFTKLAKRYGKNNIYIEQLTDYLEKGEAKELEVKTIQQHRDNGFELLNKAKGGGLGGDTIKWTKKRVLSEAKKYKTISEWQVKSGASMNAARKNDWFEQAVTHMTSSQVRHGHWKDKENVHVDALTYSTVAEWRKNSVSAYEASKKYGFYDEATSHMTVSRKPIGYWKIRSNVLAEAKNYKTITEWQKGSQASVMAARKNGWFEDAIAHMQKKQQTKGHWQIKSNVIQDAKKYNGRSEWSNKSSAAYNSASKNGWFEEATAHMVRPRKPMGYWQIKQNVIDDAKNYSDRAEWRKNSKSAYNQALENDWVGEATSHMSS